jgi:Family of unknown function (DUF6134)
MRTVAGIITLLLVHTGAQAQTPVRTIVVPAQPGVPMQTSVTRTDVSTEASVPTQSSVQAQASAPTQSSVPTQASAPTQRGVPAQASAPTQRGVPTQASAPTQRGVQTQASAPAPTSVSTQTDTRRFTITRDGQPIGTQAIEINRAGEETSVNIATDLTVKVMFITAYRFEQKENERWVNGQLVGLTSKTNSNGTRHSVQVTANETGLDIKADGKVSRVDQNILPGTFWNPELLQRPTLLDTQAGKVAPLTVRDNGTENLKIKAQVVKARHYTVNSLFSQDLWYDDQARLVQSKMVASDGSVIMYHLL